MMQLSGHVYELFPRLLVCQVHVRPVSPQIYGAPHIVYVFDANQKFCNMIQFTIIGVVNETAAINGIFGMEKIRAGTIVNNYCLAQVTVKQAHILDIIPFIKYTRFTEETSTDNSIGVQ